jgi:hypothetical protein
VALDKDLQQEILSSIALAGKTEEPEIKLNPNLSQVLDTASGSPRIQSTFGRRAKLILSQPQTLRNLSSLQIRCALCKRVISYPAWYYEVRYAVNHFHYFVCFDKDSPNKPTAKCYRRI